MTTRGSGTIIETKYSGESVQYEQETSLVTDGFDWTLGMTKPTLLEPIDFEAELAERRETHEPHTDPDGNLGNSLFGI
jgi:hypothetical protein